MRKATFYIVCGKLYVFVSVRMSMKEKHFQCNQSPLIESFLFHHEALLVHFQESKGKTWCHIVLIKKQASANLTTHWETTHQGHTQIFCKGKNYVSVSTGLTKLQLTGHQCNQKFSTGDYIFNWSIFIWKLKKTTTQLLFFKT